MTEYGGGACDERVVEAVEAWRLSNNFKRRLDRAKMGKIVVRDVVAKVGIWRTYAQYAYWSVVPSDFLSMRK